MADELQLRLVSPNGEAFHGPVRSVALRGQEGDLCVYAGHAPMVIALLSGIATLTTSQGDTHDYLVRGGYASFFDTNATVVASEIVQAPAGEAETLLAKWTQDDTLNSDTSNTVKT